MPGKAKQYVDQSMSSVQTTVSSLQQALSSAVNQIIKTRFNKQ